MRIKMNYFNDDIIVNLFNSLLPDNYFIYITACAGVGCNSFFKFHSCQILQEA